jgi:hypothetical protein
MPAWLAGTRDDFAHVQYTAQVHLFRALVLIVPPLVFVAARIACDELRRTQVRPGAGGPGRRVRRREDAGFDVTARPSAREMPGSGRGARRGAP